MVLLLFEGDLHHRRLYYRRVEEGKQYPVLCRRLVSLNEEFISHKSPAAGFDFTSGKKIEQKLLDYNQEAERFGGTTLVFLFFQKALWFLVSFLYLFIIYYFFGRKGNE